MKKIIMSALLLVCGVCLFTACDDDNDSNPVLQHPTTFTLNTPSYASMAVDLEETDSIAFTWSQPAYGFPVVAEYQLQVSLTNDWSVAYDEELANTGEATYNTLPYYYTTCKGYVACDQFMRALQQLGGWADGEVPENLTVYVRCTSYVPGSSELSTSETIYSNVVTIGAVPYYYELKDADPELWYLTGGCIADGSWSNSASKIGTGMIPMLPLEGQSYDKATGTGIIQHVGYFPANAEFKIIAPKGLDNWNYGICGDGTDMGTTYRNGDADPGNIKIANAGYYVIQVNTADCTCTITPYTGSVAGPFSPMYITGDFDSWSVSNAMTAVETWSGAENHFWSYLLTVDSDGGVKFTIEGWGSNWGSSGFPYGSGVNNGANIPATAGTYQVYFNDISGQYYFMAIQ